MLNLLTKFPFWWRDSVDKTNVVLLQTVVLMCFMHQKTLSAMITVLLIFTMINASSGCSLALHKWELKFYLKIPVSAPFFPLAEAGAGVGKIPENAAKRVRWVADHNFFSRLAPIFLPLLDIWTGKIPWETLLPQDSILKQARRESGSDFPLIIGSDKCFIKIAFFSDSNSADNCQQLVIMQTARIRAVFPDRKSPWAQEINGQSWLSLIFFQLPIPGRILSLSAFPLSGLRQSLYEDHPFVERLLTEKKLTRRPDLEIDPYQFDFPELPE